MTAEPSHQTLQQAGTPQGATWGPQVYTLITGDRSEIAKENEKSGMAEGFDVDSGMGKMTAKET